MTDQTRETKRRQLAFKIGEKLNASARNTPPPETSLEEWVSVMDMDTNKTNWFPKDLYNEYQRLRFSDAGEPSR